MEVGSFGSKTALATSRFGRFRVMLVKVTPEGGPTVAASALVETNTCWPTAMTTLFPLALATSTLPMRGNARRIRQFVPAFWVCHRFWLPLTYTTPALPGSVVIGNMPQFWSLVVPHGVTSCADGTVDGRSVPSALETNTRVQGAGQKPLVPYSRPAVTPS